MNAFIALTILSIRIPHFGIQIDKINSDNSELIQNSITHIFQDSEERIWIGSYAGLNYYDGMNFSVFDLDQNTPEKSTTSIIKHISEDYEKRLWLIDGSENVLVLDLNTERLIPTDELIPDRTYSYLFKITHTRSATFLCSWRKLFCIKRTKNPKLKNIISLKPDLPDEDRLVNVHVINDQQIKAVSKNGKIFSIDTSQEPFDVQKIDLQLRPHATIKNTHVTPEGELYLSNFNSIRKLNHQGKLSFVRESESMFFTMDRSSNIWISNGNAIKCYQQGEGGSLNLMYSSSVGSARTQVSSNRVSSMLFDASGTIWIGTQNLGICKINPYRLNIEHLPLNDTHAKSTQSIKASTLLALDDELYIGTATDGLLKYSFEDKKTRTITPKQPSSYQNKRPSIRLLQKINYKNTEQILISTFNGRLYSIDLMHHLNRGKPELPNALVELAVSSNCVYQTGKYLWLGSFWNGLTRYNLDTDEIKKFRVNANDPSSISSMTIRSLCQAKEGGLWIGTKNGLNYLPKSELSGNTPAFQNFKHDPAHPHSLSLNSILPIYEASDGTLWIGTFGGGLNSMTKMGEFQVYNKLNGLADNIVKSIVEDDEGNIWVSGNNGLSMINARTHQITNVTKADGLQSNEFSEFAGLKTKSGKLVFGGVNGLSMFQPKDLLRSASSKGKMVLTKLNINNEYISPGKKLDHRVYLDQLLDKQKRLTLENDHNNFTISVALRSHLYPDKVKFRYRLAGLEKRWTTFDLNYPVIKYTSVPPGDYQLIIEQLSENEKSIVQKRTLYLTVSPSKWASKTAVAIYAFLSGLLIYGIYLYQVAYRKMQIEKYANEKNQEVTKLKLKFFTNISHEFRTPLTLISGYLQQEVQAHPYADNENLTIATQNVNRLKRLIDQLMDFRRLEQEEMRLESTPVDLSEIVREVYKSFKVMAENKHIDFTFQAPDHKVTGVLDADKVEKVLFNLLSNAFKYTQEGGKITLSLKWENHHAQIRVIDDGKGIPLHLQPFVFDRFFTTADSKGEDIHGTGVGLAFTKKIVDLLGGSISFKSEENVGTTFEIMLPVATNDHLDDMAYLPQADKEIEVAVSPKNRRATEIPLNVKHQLLIIDDNEAIRTMIRKSFQDDFIIYEAENGEEGLKQCYLHSPDLVISDIMMPVMDGYLFCRRLKEDPQINHIPVILLSAKNSPQSQVDGFYQGADGYVSKPFDIDVLKAHCWSIIQSRQEVWKKFNASQESWTSDFQLDDLQENFLNQIKEHIENAIEPSDFSVAEVAKACALSSVTFNKKVKAITGLTAKSLIRKLQLRMAKQLLDTGNYSVAEVTYKVGFNDLNHFRNLFKATFAQTPTEYKNEKRD